MDWTLGFGTENFGILLIALALLLVGCSIWLWDGLKIIGLVFWLVGVSLQFKVMYDA